MKKLLKGLSAITLLAGLAGYLMAADSTFDGVISDSMCGASHAKMTQGKQMTDRDCTLACVRGGGKYIFVANGKIYVVSNQNLAALQQYAGRRVSLTGEVKGDTITVSKIADATKK